MKMNKGDVSIDTIVILVILLAFLVLGLLFLGVMNNQSNSLVQAVLDFITGK